MQAVIFMVAKHWIIHILRVETELRVFKMLAKHAMPKGFIFPVFYIISYNWYRFLNFLRKSTLAWQCNRLWLLNNACYCKCTSNLVQECVFCMHNSVNSHCQWFDDNLNPSWVVNMFDVYIVPNSWLYLMCHNNFIKIIILHWYWWLCCHWPLRLQPHSSLPKNI